MSLQTNNSQNRFCTAMLGMAGATACGLQGGRVLALAACTLRADNRKACWAGHTTADELKKPLIGQNCNQLPQIPIGTLCTNNAHCLICMVIPCHPPLLYIMSTRLCMLPYLLQSHCRIWHLETAEGSSHIAPRRRPSQQHTHQQQRTVWTFASVRAAGSAHTSRVQPTLVCPWSHTHTHTQVDSLCIGQEQDGSLYSKAYLYCRCDCRCGKLCFAPGKAALLLFQVIQIIYFIYQLSSLAPC